MQFPESFVWGTATSSYQIEGAHDIDGKAPSIWDVFAHTPGKVWQEQTGDVACDHYHRYADDIALMQQIGLQAYRFSLSWPRILPEGTGEANPAGLDFYDRLLDALLEAGIVPYVTLYHWDLPHALYRRGGWMNRASADWFADYTALVADRFRDRVKYWITFNEPAVFINMGYGQGIHAPGDQRPRCDLLQIIHHVLLAHGKAVQALRASVPESHVSITLDHAPGLPYDQSPAEIAIARHWTFDGMIGGEHDFWCTALYADPIIKGDYPPQAYQRYAMPTIADGDLATIAQPIDSLCLNIYRGAPVRTTENGYQVIPNAVDMPYTRFDWAVTPEALYWGPRLCHERYGLPIYITENGLSSMDWVTLDGKVPDMMRIDYIRRYLRALGRAIQDGVEVRGYFHWSLMDNFEWAEGYKQRFGLIHNNFATQARTLKASAYWYKELILSNGANL